MLAAPLSEVLRVEDLAIGSEDRHLAAGDARVFAEIAIAELTIRASSGKPPNSSPFSRTRVRSSSTSGFAAILAFDSSMPTLCPGVISIS